jgi:hypothetical protein
MHQSPLEAVFWNSKTPFMERGEALNVAREWIWHLLVVRRDPLGLRIGGTRAEHVGFDQCL